MTVNATGTTPTTTQPTPSIFGASGGDFNMFLRLLTTQMQNQDPLNPMDTSEYTQQLVQYSQVEQSIQQTGVLRDILSRMTTQDMAQASGFIGRDVELDSPVAGLSSAAPASWVYDLPRNAGTLTATITDANGRTVETRTLVAGGASGRFDWDGTLANGTKATPGAYTLALSAQDANGATLPVAIRSVGRVQDVAAAGGEVFVGVNGAQLPVAKIIRVAPAQG